MVAKGPPMAAHSIIMRPGFVLTVSQGSLSWPFFAQAINDHNPLNGSFAPAESVAKANVTVNAISGALVPPQDSDTNREPYTPCASAKVGKAVYGPQQTPDATPKAMPRAINFRCCCFFSSKTSCCICAPFFLIRSESDVSMRWFLRDKAQAPFLSTSWRSDNRCTPTRQRCRFRFP